MAQRGQDDPLPQLPASRKSFDEAELGLQREASGPQTMFDDVPVSRSQSAPVRTRTRPRPTKNGQQHKPQQQQQKNRTGSKGLENLPPSRTTASNDDDDNNKKPATKPQDDDDDKAAKDSGRRTHRVNRNRATREGDDDSEGAISSDNDDEDQFPGATRVPGRNGQNKRRQNEKGRMPSVDNLIVGDGSSRECGVSSLSTMMATTSSDVSTHPSSFATATTPQGGGGGGPTSSSVLSSTITVTSEEISVIATLAPDEDEIAKEIDDRVNDEVAKRLLEERQERQLQLEQQQQQQQRQQRTRSLVTVEAVKVEDKKPASRKILLRNILRATIMIAALVVGIVSIGIASSSSSSQSNEDTTAAPPSSSSSIDSFTSRFEQLYDLIGAEVSATPVETLRDRSTPQHDAMAWMADEDEAEMIFSLVENKQRLIERYVLALLYLEMGGEQNDSDGDSSWLVDYNFLSSLPVCAWTRENGGFDRGVLCSGFNVTEIRLPSNGLQGTIPTEVALLTSLRYLNLEDNLVVGTFPSLSLPTSLTKLWLSENLLQGALPVDIAERFIQLSNLDLRNNLLSGAIPNQLFDLTNLNRLDLAFNLFQGTLPTQIGRLTNLNTWLSIAGNKIAGRVPTELGLLTGLEYLFFRSNLFVGTVPTELGLLKRLLSLAFQETDMSGTLPSELGQLTKMAKLRAYSIPNLGGPIPTEIVALPALTWFESGGTQLTGYEKTICGVVEDRTTPWSILTADCGGDDRRVECSCCTSCRDD